MQYSYHKSQASLELSEKILKDKTGQTRVAPSPIPESVTDNIHDLFMVIDNLHTLLDTVNGIVALAPQ